ncbi:MAG: WecB/TagA/CpsF family glycosyltransferase [Burkholderiaceae bacterium]|nr:WecB/TagA/CpsF family glycosyltransferase [Roseateles sp.]MBV8468240.1 WecB/TagA/CpsF family glycosyltransferase [Burkholderiaceae bacterium]
MSSPAAIDVPPHRDSMIETSLFGIRLTAGTLRGAVHHIMDLARARRGGMVCVANVDMLTRAKRTPHLAQLMKSASLAVTDGMPLVWALRRLQGMEGIKRVDGPHLTRALCMQAQVDNAGVFLYGGSADELAGMQAQLNRQFPALRICGAISPPQLPSKPLPDPHTVAIINASGAQLVFVGLGCPKQEYWMQAQQGELSAVALGVGFAFALIAGSKKEAPRWMQRRGLEWLFRLVQEPRRLWKRYLLGNSLFVALFLAELFKRALRSPLNSGAKAP